MKKPLSWTDLNVALAAGIREAVANRSPRYVTPTATGWTVSRAASLFGDCYFVSAKGRIERLEPPRIDESGEVAGNLDTLPLFA